MMADHAEADLDRAAGRFTRMSLWRQAMRWLRSQPKKPLTTFEQALIANSLIILGSTVAAYWVTHQVLETYHFLIDSLFVLLATLIGVGVNAIFLRRLFAPLIEMQTTIEAIQSGTSDRRAMVDVRAADVAQLAEAFNAMLDALEAQRHARLREIATAQEEERRRLALELHDATGQDLTALILRLEMLRQDLGDPALEREALVRHLDTISEQAQRALQGVQVLARQLRPSILDDLGLVAALRWLGQEMSHDGAAEVHVIINEPEAATELDSTLSHLAETMLFRVAQEALSNATRHSEARHIALSLKYTMHALILTVQDDGRGFELETTAGRRGSGLRGMRERLAVVSGRLAIRSRPGAGTSIEAWVPLSSGEEP